MTETKIKLVRHREKAKELVDLFRASFGHDMSVELWDWKYIQHPLASGDPEIIVAMDNGKIVGARPLLLAEMWLKDEKTKVAQPCDTMVHPEYQRQGILSRMNQFAIEHFREDGYALFYNFPNMQSYPGYLKLGWRKVSLAENLFQVINPQIVLDYKLGRRFLVKGLGLLYNAISKTGKHRSLVVTLPNNYQTEVVDQFVDELKQDYLRDKSAIELDRSEDYLRWRFDQHPENSYKYILARKDNRLCGYGVVSTEDMGRGLIRGRVIDYLVEEGNIEGFRVIMDACLNELRKRKCSFISVSLFGNPRFSQELIDSFGFKSSQRLPYRRFFEEGNFVVRQVSDWVMEKTDIYDREKWNVTDAYRDST